MTLASSPPATPPPHHPRSVCAPARALPGDSLCALRHGGCQRGEVHVGVGRDGLPAIVDDEEASRSAATGETGTWARRREGWTDGRTDGRMDGRTDGRTDGGRE